MPSASTDWDKKHQRNLSSYGREVDDLFDTAVREAARIADLIRELKGEKPFSFDDYPAAKKRVDKLLERLTRNVTTSVVSGIRSEWTLANEKNNELCNRVFGDKAEELTEAQRRQYYTTNSKARQAFEQRRVNGLNLSDRVWRYTSQFKEEIEWGIDIGLRQGRSAAEMARDLKQYLVYPDKLFRRVRDEHGNLRLSRSAKAFHPGMGVYRSSYKNARRLAVTETNMAYRTSDYERWQKLDFVVGMHIIRSNNHTTTDSRGKRVKLVDICDELSGDNERDTKGRYPKSFKFTGWHPQCRCYAVSILKTEEERREDRRRRLAGEEPLPASASVNYVADVPQEFKKWVTDNSKRIGEAKSLPYFISDNRETVDMVLNGGKPKRTALDVARERHAKRTEKDKAEIKARWEERKNTAPTLKRIDGAISEYRKTDLVNPALVEREAEVNEAMRLLFENADFGMQQRKKNLESLIQNGFLNTFQTGTSTGFNPSKKTSGEIEHDNVRLLASQRMFAPKDSSFVMWRDSVPEEYNGPQHGRSEYEKYGRLFDKDMYRNYTSSQHYDQYGELEFRFRKDRVQCTWTAADSLCAGTRAEYYQPTRTSSPGIESFDRKYHATPDFIINGVKRVLDPNDAYGVTDFQEEDLRTNYLELQYHGTLTIDDVESIVFPSNPMLDKSVKKSTIQQLQSKGIEIFYIDGDKATKLSANN